MSHYMTCGWPCLSIEGWVKVADNQKTKEKTAHNFICVFKNYLFTYWGQYWINVMSRSLWIAPQIFENYLFLLRANFPLFRRSGKWKWIEMYQISTSNFISYQIGSTFNIKKHYTVGLSFKSQIHYVCQWYNGKKHIKLYANE